MGTEATLTVPAEHVEAFRSAAITELGHDAQWVLDGQETVERERLENERLVARGEAPKPIILGDIEGAANCLGEVLVIARQLFEVGPGDVKVRGDASALAHTAETMGRKIVGPRLSEALGYGPYDAPAIAGIRKEMAALDWAVADADRLHGVAAKEIAARKAVAA